MPPNTSSATTTAVMRTGYFTFQHRGETVRFRVALSTNGLGAGHARRAKANGTVTRRYGTDGSTGRCSRCAGWTGTSRMMARWSVSPITPDEADEPPHVQVRRLML